MEAHTYFCKTSNRWYVMQGKKQLGWYLQASIAFAHEARINATLK